MRKLLFIILFVCTVSNIEAQNKSVNEIIQSGNEYYQQQEYTKANAEYTNVLKKDPENVTAKFNQANTLFKQNKKVEAAILYNDITKTATDKELLSKAWYNKGVVLSDQKNLEESIEAYKNALRNNPTDKDARENLQKALLELKKKEPPKKKDDHQKKKQNPQQQQSKMSMKEAEQRLKLLQQKEREVQQRIQKDKTKGGGSQTKDW